MSDFGAGGVGMGVAVGGIAELVGPDCAGQFGGEAAGDLLVVVVVLVGFGQHRAYDGTEHAQHFHFFGRLAVEDDDDAAITACGAQVGGLMPVFPAVPSTTVPPGLSVS